jgi:hypothetical protein
MLSPAKLGVAVTMKQSGFRTKDELNDNYMAFGRQRFVAGLNRVIGRQD